MTRIDIVRPRLERFTSRMESKLALAVNQNKADWRNEGHPYLIMRLMEEVGKLIRTMNPSKTTSGDSARLEAALELLEEATFLIERCRGLRSTKLTGEEAADVANFSMMIYDKHLTTHGSTLP